MPLREPRARHLTKAFIHLDHLTHNVRLLQAQVRNVRLWPVLTANAYGHDAVNIGSHLVRLGYDTFGVADVDEAVALAEAGVRATFVVLSATLPSHSEALVAYGCEPVVCTLDMVEALARAAAKAEQRVRVHLNVDTGMGRIRIRSDEVPAFLDRCRDFPALSHNFVDPFHIILRLDGMDLPGSYRGGYLDVDKATFYTIFMEEDRTVMVDELPSPRSKRLGRRLDDRQHLALVNGTVTDSSGRPVEKGTAVLWKVDRGEQHPFTNGRYAVAIASPGKYRLEVKGSGFSKASREIELNRGQVYRKDFTLAPGGVIKGTVVDAAGRALQDGDVFYRDGTTSYGVSIDRDGTYRLEGLAPGTYAVSVMVGEKSMTLQVLVEAGRESVQDFVIK